MSIRSQLLPASFIQHSTLECCHDMHHSTDISSHFSFCFLLLIRSDDEAFHFHILWMIPQPSFSSENVNNVYASMEHAQENERICINEGYGWRMTMCWANNGRKFFLLFFWFILHSFFSPYPLFSSNHCHRFSKNSYFSRFHKFCGLGRTVNGREKSTRKKFWWVMGWSGWAHTKSTAKRRKFEKILLSFSENFSARAHCSQDSA